MSDQPDYDGIADDENFWSGPTWIHFKDRLITLTRGDTRETRDRRPTYAPSGLDEFAPDYNNTHDSVWAGDDE